MQKTLSALVLTATLVAQGSRPTTALALPNADTLRVEVFEDATGKPIPEATVLYLHADDVRQAKEHFAREWDALYADLELRLERFGRSVLTGADGVAFVPRAGLGDDIAVRKGNLYAQTGGMRTKQIEVLRAGLVENPPVRVRVVDAHDRPCPSVTVWLLRGNDAVPIDAGKTRADGVRVVPRALTFHDSRGLRVAVRLPGLDLRPVELDPKQMPADDLVFKLPPSGALRLRLVDGKGDAIREPAVAYVDLVTALDDMRGPRLGVDIRSRTDVPLEAKDRGEVVVPYVGLGLALRLNAITQAVRFGSVDLAGPKDAGTEVAATLRLDADLPVLVGKAVDEKGRPLRDRTLVGRMQFDAKTGDARSMAQHGGPATHVVHTCTDSEGTFRIRPPVKGPAGLASLLVRVDESGLAAPPIGPLRLAPGETALGPTVFALEPLVVSGRVICPGPTRYRPILTVEALRNGRWERCDLQNLVWSDDGTFEFRGRIEPVGEQLRIVSRDLGPWTGAQGEYPFRLGQKDLPIEVGR